MPESQSTIRERLARPSDRISAPVIPSQIIKTKWPVITKTVYDSMARREPNDGKTNKKLQRLAKARIDAGRLLLSLDNAILDHSKDTSTEGKAIYAKLRTFRNQVEKAWREFPLELR